MERVIKFRGRTKEGMWLYGNLVQFNGMTSIVSDEEVEKTPLDHVGGKIVSSIVDKDTVGQFTGLKDKNGKEIYEGDVVEAWSEGCKAVGMIKSRNDGLWIMFPAWQDNQFWNLVPNADGKTFVDVIGNIWENKDLIE